MTIGFAEFAILGLVVLLLFGSGKIAGVMGDFARGLTSFKRGLSEAKDEGFLGGGKGSGSGAAPSAAEAPRRPDNRAA